MRSPALHVAVLALLLVAPLSRARATDDPDEEVARRHLERGRALYAGERYEEAVYELELGRVIKPLPIFALELARACDRLASWPDAAAWYRTYLATAPGAEQAERAEASARLRELTARLAAEHLTEAPPPDAKPAGTAAPRRLRIVGQTVAASGVLVVGIGAIFAALGNVAVDDLNRLDRTGGVFDPGRYRDYKVDRGLEVAFFVLGGAAVAGGIIATIIGWRHGGGSPARALLPSSAALVRF
jgi:hypothetical protein